LDELTGLRRALRSLYRRMRRRMRSRWSRDLPFDEVLFDRWERAQSLGFGDGTSIYHNSYVYGDVRVGRETWIGPFTVLDGSGGLAIGDNCSISSGVQIYTHDSVKWALSGGVAEYERSSVRIGDCCYLGPNVVVARGVEIGSHALVGAHSFVNRDVPPYAIAVGAPARAIGRVEIATTGEVSLRYHEQR
jgi:acetyltransferase-like isoleucine patch superfamily enzyme